MRREASRRASRASYKDDRDERRSVVVSGEVYNNAQLETASDSDVSKVSRSSKSGPDIAALAARVAQLGGPQAEQIAALIAQVKPSKSSKPSKPSKSRDTRAASRDAAKPEKQPSAKLSTYSSAELQQAQTAILTELAAAPDPTAYPAILTQLAAGSGVIAHAASSVISQLSGAHAAQAAAVLAQQIAQTKQQLQDQQAAKSIEGGVDPLAVPVPPELGSPIYSWVRRLALQADLTGADKVLREAFVDMTSSLSVAVIYPGTDGLWTLGDDEEIPKDATAIVGVANARRTVIQSHQALIPIVTSTETVAVVVLTRNPRNPAYHPIEQVAMVALARESAAILHHLAIAHLQKTSEIKADQGGLYRADALEAHRTRGNEGVPVNLSPGWVKRAYPLLIVMLLGALGYAIFARVPTWSTGPGMVKFNGTSISAPFTGPVDKIFVKAGQGVEKGQIIAKLNSAEQDTELRLATTEYENLVCQYMYDQQDANAKNALATSLNRIRGAKEKLETRNIRAPRAGTLSDLHIVPGQPVQFGDVIAQINDPDQIPEVWTYLPGKDRPRVREGMELQIELTGYVKIREKAIITSISNENIGPPEAMQTFGKANLEAIKLAPGQTYFLVKAKLPGKTFKTQHRTLWYHHGMIVKTEVKIQNKPFLATLLPGLEKYLPD